MISWWNSLDMYWRIWIACALLFLVAIALDWALELILPRLKRALQRYAAKTSTPAFCLKKLSRAVERDIERVGRKISTMRRIERLFGCGLIYAKACDAERRLWLQRKKLYEARRAIGAIKRSKAEERQAKANER